MQVEAQIQNIDVLLHCLSNTTSAPSALLQPRAESLLMLRGELVKVVQEMQTGKTFVALATPEELREMEVKQKKVDDIVKALATELAAEPWFNPPAQRRMLKVEKQLVEAVDVLCKHVLNVCRKEESQFKYVRRVNMNDPADVKASGMDDDTMRKEDDRLGDHHGISTIVMTASGCTSGKGLAEVFGPKAHCANTMNRILYSMS
eukprot:TRINITY_DN49506_c0_g1_i1.p1 TRINITY_DN49506_c0_g1~~TRINITY_DN49506_c0_g1_i1.p1  ORF type:complete len:204 (+),score=50.35 TRINITY_DN49506_c0_g1_i1:69-680(+)